MPRTRGGLPCPECVKECKEEFAPHTRGSTLRRVYVGVPALVCPAHAGVYPVPGLDHRVGHCLPRTRGGLPWPRNGRGNVVEFAPHTRGSTLRRVYVGVPALVCPAHAGVYPVPGLDHRVGHCLPRTRGGLPWPRNGRGNVVEFAPHTRGSTRSSFLALESRAVCPAHAGVYRPQGFERRWDVGLPRTRGGLPSL